MTQGINQNAAYFTIGYEPSLNNNDVKEIKVEITIPNNRCKIIASRTGSFKDVIDRCLDFEVIEASEENIEGKKVWKRNCIAISAESAKNMTVSAKVTKLVKEMGEIKSRSQIVCNKSFKVSALGQVVNGNVYAIKVKLINGEVEFAMDRLPTTCSAPQANKLSEHELVNYKIVDMNDVDTYELLLLTRDLGCRIS